MVVFFIISKTPFNDNFEEFTSLRFILTLVGRHLAIFSATNGEFQL